MPLAYEAGNSRQESWPVSYGYRSGTHPRKTSRMGGLARGRWHPEGGWFDGRRKFRGPQHSPNLAALISSAR